MAESARWTDESAKDFWRAAGTNFVNSFTGAPMVPYPEPGGGGLQPPPQTQPTTPAPTPEPQVPTLQGTPKVASQAQSGAPPTNLSLPGGMNFSFGQNGSQVFTQSDQNGGTARAELPAGSRGLPQPGSTFLNTGSQPTRSPYTVTGDPEAVAAFNRPVFQGGLRPTAAPLGEPDPTNGVRYFGPSTSTTQSQSIFTPGMNYKERRMALADARLRLADQTMQSQERTAFGTAGLREAGETDRALLNAGVQTGVAGLRYKTDAEQNRIAGLRAQTDAGQLQLAQEDAASVRGLRTAQADLAKSTAEQGKFLKLKVQTGVDEFKSPIYGELAVDAKSGKVVYDPRTAQGGQGGVEQYLNPVELGAFNKLPPEKRKVAEQQILSRVFSK